MSSLIDEIMKARNEMSQEEYQRLYFGEPYEPDPNLICCRCLRSEVEVSHEGGIIWVDGKPYCRNKAKCNSEFYRKEYGHSDRKPKWVELTGGIDVL